MNECYEYIRQISSHCILIVESIWLFSRLFGLQITFWLRFCTCTLAVARIPLKLALNHVNCDTKRHVVLRYCEWNSIRLATSLRFSEQHNAFCKSSITYSNEPKYLHWVVRSLDSVVCGSTLLITWPWTILCAVAGWVRRDVWCGRLLAQWRVSLEPTECFSLMRWPSWVNTWRAILNRILQSKHIKS